VDRDHMVWKTLYLITCISSQTSSLRTCEKLGSSFRRTMCKI